MQARTVRFHPRRSTIAIDESIAHEALVCSLLTGIFRAVPVLFPSERRDQ